MTKIKKNSHPTYIIIYTLLNQKEIHCLVRQSLPWRAERSLRELSVGKVRHSSSGCYIRHTHNKEKRNTNNWSFRRAEATPKGYGCKAVPGSASPEANTGQRLRVTSSPDRRNHPPGFASCARTLRQLGEEQLVWAGRGQLVLSSLHLLRPHLSHVAE